MQATNNNKIDRADGPTPGGSEGEGEGEVVYSLVERVGAALAWSITSISLVWSNKIVLSVFAFPSAPVLALSQICCVILFIGVSRCFYDFGIRPFGWAPLRAIMPLPIVQLINVFAGLEGTKYVSLPMFGALRNFVLIFTLFAERYFFGTVRGPGQICSVLLIIFGAMVAAYTDLSFNALGYVATGVNNLATTAVSILNKQKSDKKAAFGGGVWGVMFYNNILFLPIMIIFILTFRYYEALEALAYPRWNDRGFLTGFLFSSALGCLLQATALWSTKVNGPLTTAVVGCMKSVLGSYGGMAMPDFHFELVHFMGINVAVVGALVYSGIEIYDASEKKRQARREEGVKERENADAINLTPPSPPQESSCR